LKKRSAEIIKPNFRCKIYFQFFWDIAAGADDEKKQLIKMIELVRHPRPGTKRNPSARVMQLYACAARVFVEANGVTAGEETLVLRDGGCTQPMKQFLALLKSYADKEIVTIEADARALRMFTTTLNVTGYGRRETTGGVYCRPGHGYLGCGRKKI
jgi:hypothetical protein